MDVVGDDLADDVRAPEGASTSRLAEALGALGVTRGLLTADQQRQLDEQGFVFLPGLLEQSAVAGLGRRFDELVTSEGDAAGIEVHQEPGTARLANLVDKGQIFDVCWNHPMVLAAVAHVYGWRPFKINSLNARAALPGEGAPAPPCRFAGPLSPGPLPELQFRVDAGRFYRVQRRHPGHPGIAPLAASAGRRHVRCEGCASRRNPVAGTGGELRCIQRSPLARGHQEHNEPAACLIMGGFVPRDAVQQTVQREYLRPATLARMSPAQRYLLDV